MSVALSNLSATFSDSANTYNAISMNVSNTGGFTSDSTLIQLGVEGTYYFKVHANGRVISTGSAEFGGISVSNFSPVTWILS